MNPKEVITATNTIKVNVTHDTTSNVTMRLDTASQSEEAQHVAKFNSRNQSIACLLACSLQYCGIQKTPRCRPKPEPGKISQEKQIDTSELADTAQTIPQQLSNRESSHSIRTPATWPKRTEPNRQPDPTMDINTTLCTRVRFRALNAEPTPAPK